MGFFGIGTEKKTDVEEENTEEDTQEEDEQEEEKDTTSTRVTQIFLNGIKGMSERQLLKFAIMIYFDDQYYGLGSFEQMIKIVKEDE